MQLKKCPFHSDEFNCCKSTQKLPRKKKKELKKLHLILNDFFNYYDFMWGLDKCNQEDYYTQYKVYYNKVRKVIEYKKEILMLMKLSFENIQLNEEGKLCFITEHDNGLYTETDLLPFYYTKESSGETWSYDEILTIIGVDELPSSVVNDYTFLKYVRELNN